MANVISVAEKDVSEGTGWPGGPILNQVEGGAGWAGRLVQRACAAAGNQQLEGPGQLAQPEHPCC